MSQKVDTSNCKQFIEDYKRATKKLLLNVQTSNVDRYNSSNWIIPYFTETFEGPCQLDEKIRPFNENAINKIQSWDSSDTCGALQKMLNMNFPLASPYHRVYPVQPDVSHIVSRLLRHCPEKYRHAPKQQSDWPQIFLYPDGIRHVPMFVEK